MIAAWIVLGLAVALCAWMLWNGRRYGEGVPKVWTVRRDVDGTPYEVGTVIALRAGEWPGTHDGTAQKASVVAVEWTGDGGVLLTLAVAPIHRRMALRPPARSAVRTVEGEAHLEGEL